MDAFLCRIYSVSLYLSSLHLPSPSYSCSPKGILARLHLNIMPQTRFIFTVFSDLPDDERKKKNTPRRRARLVGTKKILFIASFIVIWRIGKRCLKAFRAKSGWKQYQSNIKKQLWVEQKIVHIQWKWPFYGLHCFHHFYFWHANPRRFFLFERKAAREWKKSHYDMDVSSRITPVVSHDYGWRFFAVFFLTRHQS